MYDIKWIRENPDVFKDGLARRNVPPETIEQTFAKLCMLDDQRRARIALAQSWQEKRNRISKEIGLAKAANNEARAAELLVEMTRLKSDITNAGSQVASEKERLLDEALAEIPNRPLDDVPYGNDESDNVEYHPIGEKRQYPIGEKPKFEFRPKEHFEIGEALGLMDFETATKLSGARFVVNKGPLARLERALGQYMLDLHTGEHGYMEVNPPLLVRDEAMFGTAQLPKFREDQFGTTRLGDRSDLVTYIVRKYEENKSIHVDETAVGDVLSRLMTGGIVYEPGNTEEKLVDFIWRNTATYAQSIGGQSVDLWLIPTAEVPLTNLVRELILDEKELPIRVTALTPCFRAEAGAAGRDTRGMIRQHQFTKVELVSITTPEQSLAEHERMLGCAEEVLKRLNLPYRAVTLCTGDMGFASQKTYDIEVWLPGQDRYREISSVSVCGDFQARRMNARYRPEGAKNTRFVHTLNGSGVAVGRALVAVLENYQNEDGSITVPEALLPYMGGLARIEKTR